MTRDELAKALLRAIEKTWEHMETVEPYDAVVYDRIIRGGCQSYIDGSFCPEHDSVPLAIALFTLARQAILQRSVEAQEEKAS